MEKNILLVIETASRGGSVSIFRDNLEVDCWSGEAAISRSEDLLDEIDSLLKRNNLSKQTIAKIFLSQGQGSITGLRVGKALGLGLKNALNLEIEFYDFQDIFRVLAEDNKKVIIVYEAGRKEYVWLRLQASIIDTATDIYPVSTAEKVSSIDDISSLLSSEIKDKVTKIYLPLKLAEDDVFSKTLINYDYKILKSNFSYYLGLFGTSASDKNDKLIEKPVEI